MSVLKWNYRNMHNNELSLDSNWILKEQVPYDWGPTALSRLRGTCWWSLCFIWEHNYTVATGNRTWEQHRLGNRAWSYFFGHDRYSLRNARKKMNTPSICYTYFRQTPLGRTCQPTWSKHFYQPSGNPFDPAKDGKGNNIDYCLLFIQIMQYTVCPRKKLQWEFPHQ